MNFTSSAVWLFYKYEVNDTMPEGSGKYNYPAVKD